MLISSINGLIMVVCDFFWTSIDMSWRKDTSEDDIIYCEPTTSAKWYQETNVKFNDGKW